MTTLDTTPVELVDPQQAVLDQAADEGQKIAIQGTINAESALGADGSLLKGETRLALASAITAARAQMKDAEVSARSVVSGHPVDAAQYLSGLEARVKAREDQYTQAREAAIDELLERSAPAIDEHISEARVASMAGLLRDALKLAKPEALVTEAIKRNDDVALHHLLGDSLWPLMVAKGVDMRALRSSAAEQRWAAGQKFPGSKLLEFLCGDGATLGAQARDAAVAKFNAVKRAQTKARRAQNGR